MLWLTILLFITSCLILVASGAFLVRSLIILTKFLRLSRYMGAFIIMAFSTSLPELFIGISSALEKNSALAFGTVIGSNIANITLIGGITVIMARKVNITRLAIKNDVLAMIGLGALPMILMLIGNKLSRIDAVILLIVFSAYTYHLIKVKKEYSLKIKDHINKWHVLGAMLVFILSIGLLYGSSHYVVKYGIKLGLGLTLPPIFVGLFFLALGTSLPELVFTVKAMQRKHPEFAIGDLIGSVVINSTLVLAVTALIFPIYVNFFLFLTSAIFMILALVLFAAFVRSGNKFTYLEGISLLLLYILFIIVEMNIQQYVV
ncbi:hypothetical protein GF358_04365 [Candidatus Woesearchaeota archaeon]|nr:hypothetical protein [Candidatus Woesearchaeota archaeon]